MSNLYHEDVTEGQEVPSFQRTSDLMHWNRFAAVNDEFVYVHMDDEYARKRGEQSAFAMGNLRFCYLHNMLRSWVGDWGRIKRVICQNRGIQYKGDTLTCRGRVMKKYSKGQEQLIDLDVWVENQNGDKIGLGQATVALPKRKP